MSFTGINSNSQNRDSFISSYKSDLMKGLFEERGCTPLICGLDAVFHNWRLKVSCSYRKYRFMLPKCFAAGHSGRFVIFKTVRPVIRCCIVEALCIVLELEKRNRLLNLLGGCSRFRACSLP